MNKKAFSIVRTLIGQDVAAWGSRFTSRPYSYLWGGGWKNYDYPEPKFPLSRIRKMYQHLKAMDEKTWGCFPCEDSEGRPKTIYSFKYNGLWFSSTVYEVGE